MSERPMPVANIISAGVGLGLAGDFLLRAPGGPGLNLALLFAGLAASLVIVSRNRGARIGREASVLLALGVIAGAGFLWRGSELLAFLAFVAASAAFALPALHAGGAWVRRARVADLFEAVAASGAWAALGSFRLLREQGWKLVGSEESHGPARSVARSALVGGLLAIVPLLVFGALFLSADRVFAGIVEDLVTVDLGAFVSHLVVTAILSWLACGYLAGFTSGTRLEDRFREMGPPRPLLGAAEVVTALALVDALFLAFVLVQFRYLFGGAGWVEVTPGLTYAEYAREGFFQLVVATALGLPWLLAASWLLGEREGGPGRWVFRAFAGAQLLLLLAIVASAIQRMRVYLDAYGLTEDRIVATAILVWLALLVVWFGATVLRGRRARFAFGGLVSAYALVASLHVANPAAVAARSHLDRAYRTASSVPGDEPALDARYLASLGSDAAPILVRRFDDLSDGDRCLVARRLLSRWGPEGKQDWRSWNAADRRARDAVGADAARLRSLAGVGGTCD